MADEIVIASPGRLTSTEAEAMLWVAMEKMSWEAGRILSVTEGTMNVERARRLC